MSKITYKRGKLIIVPLINIPRLKINNYRRGEVKLTPPTPSSCQDGINVFTLFKNKMGH